MIESIVAQHHMAVFYTHRRPVDRHNVGDDAEASEFYTNSDDIILTVTRSPFNISSSSGRRRSFDKSTGSVDPVSGITSEQRLLDAHHIDAPPYWLPLQPVTLSKPPFNLQTQTSKSNNTNKHNLIMGQTKRAKGHKVGGGRQKRHPSPLKRRPPEEGYYQESSTITVNMATSTSCPETFYPIFLPMDQEYKAKYVMNTKKGKTLQEKTFLFLEHPCGWICFTYHFSV